MTPDLANLRKDGYSPERLSVCTERGLLGVEEIGRYSLELSSLSETLILSLSRSITSSLKPFRFRDDAVEQDAAILFAALAKVTAEQMATNQPSCMRKPSFGDVRLC